MKIHSYPRPKRSRRIFGRPTRLIAATALIIGVVAFLSCWTLYVRAQNDRTDAQVNKPQHGKPELVPGELLVRFQPDSALARIRDKRTTSLQLLAEGRKVSV